MTRRAVAAALCAGIAGTGAEGASAATFAGQTSQDRKITVRTGPDGLVNDVRVRFRAPCYNGSFTRRVDFIPPLKLSETRRFRDGGVLRVEEDPFTYRITVHIRGRRLDGPARWRGRFRVEVLVKRGGEYVDTCRKRGVRWRARRL